MTATDIRSAAVSGIPSSSWRRMLAGLARLLVVPIIVFALWALAADILESSVFPGPIESMQGLGVDLGRESFRASIFATLRSLTIAWLLAAVVGTLGGFLLGLSTFWSRVFETPLFALYSIPKVTLYPVFLLFLG